MSDHMNMEASSVLKTSETGQSSSARRTSPMHESEFGYRSLASEATEEKHVISTDENNDPEQFGPLPDNLTRNSSCGQAAKQPEDAMVNSNSELLHLLPEDAARKSMSVERDMRELNHELVPEGVNSEELVEKQNFGTLNIQSGPAETGMLGLDHHENLHLLPEDAASKNLSADQVMPELNHELVPESVNTEELVEKQNFGTENIQNGLAETWTIELDHPEKLHLVPARENLSADQDQDMSELTYELDPESVSSEELVEKQNFGTENIQKGPAETGTIERPHPEKWHLLPGDADRKNCSDRDTSELNYERLPESVNSEELVEKQNFGIENIQKGSAETGTIEPDHPEKLHLLPEDAERKICSDQDMSELNYELVPECVNSEELLDKHNFGTVNIQNGPAETGTAELHCPEQLHLLPEDVARNNSSADQDMSELNHEFVPESVNNEALAEKQKFGAENVQNGAAETRAIEFNCLGLVQSGLPSEGVSENPSSEQLRPLAEDERKSSLELLELSSDSDAVNTVPEGVISEELVDKYSFGTVNIQNGPAETGTTELYCPQHLHLLPEDAARNNLSADQDASELSLGLVQSGLPSEGVSENPSLEQLRPLAEDERKSSLELLELSSDSDAVNTVPQGVNREELVDKYSFGTANIQNGPAETGTTELYCPQQLHLLPEDAAINNLSADQDASELSPEHVPESVNSETLTEKHAVGAENVQNGAGETRAAKFNCLGLVQSDLPSEGASKNSKNSSFEKLRPLAEDDRKTSLEPLELSPDSDAVNTGLEQLRPLPDNVSHNCDFKQLEPSPKNSAKSPSKSEGRGRKTSAKSTKRKYAYSVDSTRVLRSRSREKPEALEPSNNLTGHGGGAKKEKRRKNRKKKQMKTILVDEFSRIRMHLRYFLNRMNYEQNLIDAYSGEGWKGQSVDKIKPVKELQRAKSEILRCKLRIRDLFQRLDLSIAEGRLPESLFDSEGEIDSEDIFCGKCGSKDLPADNDIILCDGACERGFHQFCLNPPLLKEDIPPDDEGWLCPGCDCKVDCIELLNDSQGTTLSVLDTWEKVFPEAAAAAGNKRGDSFGLPSDDSEDTDYEPDSSGAEKVEEDNESSSDDSDFYSSEELGTTPKNMRSLELPSDDSEDDAFDPDAPDLDEQVKQESSSSDFTSDSDDFSAVLNENTSTSKDEPVLEETMPAPSDHTKPCRGPVGGRSKVCQRKKQSLNDELLSLLESAPCQGESTPPFGKRHIERLDYKKLYEEAYGNDSSDSSDQDWKDVTDAPEKTRKKNTEKAVSGSPSGRTPIVKGTNNRDMKRYQEEMKRTPKRTCKKLDAEGTNNLPAKSHKVSSEPGSSCSGTKRSPYKRLGETVTQELLKSFKENKYPERATKEKLAKELGITVYQISKWFENVRFHFRHSSRLPESVPSKGNLPQMNPSEPGPKMVADDVHNGVKNKEPSNSLTEGSSRKGSKTPRSCRQRYTPKSSRQRSMKPRGRKRKSQLDHEAPYNNSRVSSVEGTHKLSASGRKRKAQLDHQALDDNSPISGVEETQKVRAAPLDLPRAREARKRGRPESSKSATPKGAKTRKLDHQAPERSLSIEQKQKHSTQVEMPKAREAQKRGRPKGRKSAA